jgi:hypothetical protein
MRLSQSCFPFLRTPSERGPREDCPEIEKFWNYPRMDAPNEQSGAYIPILESFGPELQPNKLWARNKSLVFARKTQRA